MYTKKVSLFAGISIAFSSITLLGFIIFRLIHNLSINFFTGEPNLIKTIISIIIIILVGFFLSLFIASNSWIYKRNNRTFSRIDLDKITEEIKEDLKYNFKFDSVEVNLIELTDSVEVNFSKSTKFQIKYSVTISNIFDENETIKEVNDKVKNQINTYFKNKMGFETDQIILKIILN